jgi:hypothetical protein
MTNTFQKSPGRELLNVRRLPARLLAEEAAVLLGFKEHDIPVLVKAGLLKPLALGPRNCVKYFPSLVIEERCRDIVWLDKASRAVLRGGNANATKRPSQPQADASKLVALRHHESWLILEVSRKVHQKRLDR